MPTNKAVCTMLVHNKNDEKGKTTTTGKSSWCRDPEEPSPTMYPSSKGLEIPMWMDFSSSSDDAWEKKVLHPYIELGLGIESIIVKDASVHNCKGRVIHQSQSFRTFECEKTQKVVLFYYSSSYYRMLSTRLRKYSL